MVLLFGKLYIFFGFLEDKFWDIYSEISIVVEEGFFIDVISCNVLLKIYVSFGKIVNIFDEVV